MNFPFSGYNHCVPNPLTMSIIGKVDEFCETLCSWDVYVERLNCFFAANDITEESKKVNIFLSVCGPKTYDIIRSLVSPSLPSSKSYDELVLLLKAHYNPKPSVIVQRFKFNTRVQSVDESIAVFVAELRKLTEFCDYGTFRDDMIRDRLVVGVRDVRIQRRLLAESEMTLETAFNIASGMEAADKNATLLQQAQIHEGRVSPSMNTPEDTETNKLTLSGRKTEANLGAKCYRCGGFHRKLADCPFRNAICHKCQKKGHIARVCRSKIDQMTAHAATRFVATEPEALVLYTRSPDPVPPIQLNLQINGKPISFELDTGCAITVCSEKTWTTTFGVDSIKKLEPPRYRLKTYTGEFLQLLGCTHVQLDHANQSHRLSVHISKGAGVNLLGRDWLREVPVLRVYRVETKSIVNDLLERFKELFSNPEEGKLKDTTVSLPESSNVQPRFFKARSLPYLLRPKVEVELERLQNSGIIEPVRYSKWATPIVPVIKSDGTVRICGDYKVTVNSRLPTETYPIPRIEDIYATLGGGRYFCKLDLAHAYQQLELDERSKDLTTISTHKGLYRYNRLPFGINSAPAIFQRTIEGCIKDLPKTTAYLDDILITGSTQEELLNNVERVFSRLMELGLRLKREKCTLIADHVEYLGFRLDGEGVHPIPEKIRPILEAPAPTNVHELRSFLGMFNHYARFLPHTATFLAPLNRLLKKNTKWHWLATEEQAFQRAKQMLVHARTLCHFNPEKPIVLYCDASPYGLGAVLTQKDCMGAEKPVAFASRTLNPAEKNYAQLDKEALAVVFGVRRFHHYLYGQRFEIRTDHKPLVGLLGENKPIPQMASPRMQRWALYLSAHQYTLTYVPGSNNFAADALSRLPLREFPREAEPPGEFVHLMEWVANSPVSAAQVKAETERDVTLAQLKRYVENGWPSKVPDHLNHYARRQKELSLYDGCLLWGSRIIVPNVLRKTILEDLHCSHPGMSRMKALARHYVWWPKIDEDIEQMVRHCESCQQARPLSPPVPLVPWNWPTKPWRRLHIDYAGPTDGHMILIVIDAHSKWIEAKAVRKATSQTTINVLRSLFCTHGIPDTVVCDNGPAFTSDEFSQFLQNNGIRLLHTPPYHPSSNGLAERAVQTVKQGILKLKGDIHTRLNRFLFGYRITPQSTTGISPSELLMGRRLRSRLDLLRPDVELRVRDQQEEMKTRYDRTAIHRDVALGDRIYIRPTPESRVWMDGEVVGKESQQITARLEDGKLCRRHLDHVRRRSAESSAPAQTDQELTQDPEICPSTDNDRNDNADDTGVPTLRRSTRLKRPVERYIDEQA